MAQIFGDLLGGGSFDLVQSFREFLITSGFFWLIWVAVALFMFFFIAAIKDSLKEFNPGKALFSVVWLFAAGIASFIAIGSAVGMIIPIAIGLAVISFTKKTIKKEVKAGVPEQAQTATVAREEEEELEEVKEEEVEEAETAKEEELAEFAIKEDFTKAQLMGLVRSRIEALKVAGYDALDQQYKVPVAGVLLGLLSKLLGLIQREDQEAASMFGLEKQKTRLESIEKNKAVAEDKMADLLSKMETAVKKFEKIDLRTEGAQTRPLMQEVLNIEQQVSVFLNQQRSLQKTSEQEEKLDLRLQKVSETSLQKFKSLVDKSLNETKKFYAELGKKIPTQQVAAEYQKVDTYFVESDKLMAAHLEASEREIVMEEEALTAQAKDLQEGMRVESLLINREKLQMRIAAFKRNMQLEQRAAQTAAKMQQELNMSAELTRKVQENIKRDMIEMQKAKEEEARFEAAGAFFEREMPL
jgi:hypothetical protein